MVIEQADRRARYKANMLIERRPKQLLYYADGKAGTGKSFTIHYISTHIQQKFSVNTAQRAAPTGVAAYSISGRTLHSLFRLPTAAKEMQPLSANTLKSLQAYLKDTTTLIIDEKSIMSLQALSFLDQRLRQIFPCDDLPFGGMDIGL